MNSKPSAWPSAWKDAPSSELAQIQGVCLDVDDTLSTGGKLTSEAYAALWALKEAGFAVIPITGRPAGWCDHFARFWPVNAVVGENGAFTFFMKDGVRKRLDTPAGITPEEGKKKLQALSKKILKEFPDAEWASDQSYREYDLAIDICEDVPAWSREKIDALLKLCKSEGAHAKLSSIHVNAWFGDYDKKSGLKHWLSKGAPGLNRVAPAWEKLLFIGDSPNDEPLFESFKFSVGVANLSKYLDRLSFPPKWITELESGAGFSEMAAKLIASRK